ncbi:MAG: Stp1/IreP family PP2C-type Ser/Thr phosphatase [Acidobacteriota bacterium]
MTISEKEAAVKLEVAASTDVGCVRSNNEDHFGYDLTTRLFVVCDGMGGMAAGERASGTAVDELLGFFAGDAESGLRADKRLHRAILHANAQVFTLAQQDEALRGMGTTLVAACVEGGTLFVGNVGDSRAYFLRGGACVQITHDHSFVGEQLRSGVLTVEEARSSPLQSLITRAVGQQAEVEPDIFTANLEYGDICLLTTDGLTRYADAEAIAELILSSATLDDACHALIARAKAAGGIDNITCLLLQFLEDQPVEADCEAAQ